MARIKAEVARATLRLKARGRYPGSNKDSVVRLLAAKWIAYERTGFAVWYPETPGVGRTFADMAADYEVTAERMAQLYYELTGVPRGAGA